jgi:RNA recognition motif-containing protein
MPNIPAEKRKCTLMVCGLPLNTSKEDILKFFSGYDVKEKEIHMLPSHSGKFSGNSLVIFEDEMETRRAMKNKNLTNMGNRFIELYEYK